MAEYVHLSSHIKAMAKLARQHVEIDQFEAAAHILRQLLMEVEIRADKAWKKARDEDRFVSLPVIPAEEPNDDSGKGGA